MSSFNGKARYPVKSNQLGMRELNISYLGASGDTVGGPDQKMVTVTDNTGGNYTITLADKAKATYGNNVFVKGFSMLTEDTTLWVEAVTSSSVTVQCRSIAGTPADADADFQICLGVHDWKIEYA